MALSPDGSVYVTGTTQSVDFPTTPGAHDETFDGPEHTTDVFLAKLSADGSTLLWSTLLAGSEGEVAYDIAVDREGAVYVAGGTWSPDFPTTPGAYLERRGGFSPGNAFVAKFSADGALDWSTLLGGGHYDEALAVAVDSRGDVYVAGHTFGDFPTTEGAYNRESGSGFVTKLAAGGSKLLWSTYLGAGTTINAIALDSEGNVYAGGHTSSPLFPTTPDAFDTTLSYSVSSPYAGDAFVSKLSPQGDSLVWSTFLGGSESDTVQDLAVDESGSVYAVGATDSRDFPTTPGSYRHLAEGLCGAFVTKIAPDGTSLAYGACLGRFASPVPVAMTVEVDEAGRATVGGFASFAPDFPTTSDGYDTSFDGPSDGFVVQLTPAGDALTYGTLIGGQSADQVSSIAIAPGSLWVAGGTISDDFPATDGSYDRTLNGPVGSTSYFLAGDAFILKLQFRSTGPHIQSMNPDGPVIGPVRSVSVTFSEPLDPPSFTSEDVSLVGPAGPIPIRRIRQISDTEFRIRFPQQTTIGEYHLTLGPDVRDLAGNLMDQDQDGQSGEVTEDQFSASFHIVPRAFVFFFTGKDAPAEGSGMEKLRTQIDAESALSKVVVTAPVFGWPTGVRARRQLAAARDHVVQFLTQHKTSSDDRVVLIGHSYGGNIAYLLAGDLDGKGPQTQAASALLTFDPIDWRLCAFLPPAADCNQSNNSRPLPKNVSGNHIVNFLQRRFGITIKGFPIETARNDDRTGQGPDGRWGTPLDPSPDDTTHTLIDNDWSPGADGKSGFANVDDDGNGKIDDDTEAGFPGSDDAVLGTHAIALDFLLELANQ